MRSALMKRGLLLTMVVPVLALASAPEAESPPEMAQLQGWQSQVSHQLAERGTADTLTTAAVLLPVSMTAYDSKATKQQRQTASHKDATARLQLLDRAAAAAPDAADIAALALQVCTRVPGCDVASHAERLQHAAPDDAGYLLPALSDAQSRQNNDKVSAILQTMADATTFNSWYATTRDRLQRGVADISVPALPPAMNLPPALQQRHSDMTRATLALSTSAVAMYGAIGMPGYGTIDKACSKESTEFLARQEACRQIGVLLSHDTSLMAANIGLAFWRRAARDKQDLAAATKATRKLDWQQQTWSEAMIGGTIDPLESLQATLDNDGEIPGVIALLKKHDLSTTPPVGWVSRREKFEGSRKQQESKPSLSCAGTP